MSLKEKLDRKGWTSARLAKVLGVNNSTTWRWVQGKSVPGKFFIPMLVQLGLHDHQHDEVKAQRDIEKSHAERMRFDPLLADLTRQRDIAVLKAHVLEKQLQAALEEIERLKSLTGLNDPVRCTVCSDVRERSERICGNCSADMHSWN